MTDSGVFADDLPLPDSPELGTLFANREVREIYRFLYERRDTPPTMAEWRDRAAEVFGKANEQTDRRLRELRRHFVVISRRDQGRWVYILKGRSLTVDSGDISARLEAQVYTLKGRRCQMCGRGPDDGVKLNIDHKVPRSWGGETELDNLEPLCERHNHGKQALFSTYDEAGPDIRRAMSQPDVWQRIGELLKAFSDRGEPVPSELITLVAGPQNQGDPARRLRELRVALKWRYRARKVHENGRVKTYYELQSWKPWPVEGPRAVVQAYERERKRRKDEGT
jgi:5-methylcytosine-specific restriction endonuclease McrA